MNANQLQKLCDASIKYTTSPYESIEWPASLDAEASWYFSPELISIYGTPTFERLTESQKKKLSFYESINFFSLNIHGEKPLIQGLAHRLYQEEKLAVSDYLHHFLDEENDHMVYFGTFCKKYAGKVYRDKKMVFPKEYLDGEEDFLFFLKVLIFEEIVDLYNIRMARDERLEKTAREINRRHHLDEARHLVFGRAMVKELFETYAPRWGTAKVEELRSYIPGYITSTWKEYFNPDVYEDAGLQNAYDLADEVYDSEPARARRKEITAGCIRNLMENNILLEATEF